MLFSKARFNTFQAMDSGTEDCGYVFLSISGSCPIICFGSSC